MSIDVLGNNQFSKKKNYEKQLKQKIYIFNLIY